MRQTRGAAETTGGRGAEDRAITLLSPPNTIYEAPWPMMPSWAMSRNKTPKFIASFFSSSSYNLRHISSLEHTKASEQMQWTRKRVRSLFQFTDVDSLTSLSPDVLLWAVSSLHCGISNLKFGAKGMAFFCLTVCALSLQVRCQPTEKPLRMCVVRGQNA